MAGQGHQFPGGFPNNSPGMRTNFGSVPLGTQMTPAMPNQMGGVMGSPMMNTNPMGAMNNPMVQAYGNGMANQMNNMSMQQQPQMTVTSVGVGGGGSVGVTAVPSASPAAVPPPLTAAAGPPNAQHPQHQQHQQHPPANKEFNTASLCRFGQETVQDIVSRTQEVFQTLKTIQPPNGTLQGANTSKEKREKIQEQLRTIRLLFKRLRLIYEKCNENCQLPGMEYTHIESLIPVKDEVEHKAIEEKKSSEAYRLVCDENRELTDQVVLKNKHLKEVINNLRTIIWEINVMLTMRRS